MPIGIVAAGYNWKNKKLDPSFMNGVKGKELLPRFVQVNKCMLGLAVNIISASFSWTYSTISVNLPCSMQVSIELDKRGGCRRCSVKRMSHQWNKPADFPAINPSFANKRSRFIYAGGASGSRKFLPYFPFDSVVKVDVSDGSSSRWSSEGRKFVGEPVFIPTGGGEDHGYVILVEVRATHIQATTLSTYIF